MVGHEGVPLGARVRSDDDDGCWSSCASMPPLPELLAGENAGLRCCSILCCCVPVQDVTILHWWNNWATCLVRMTAMRQCSCRSSCSDKTGEMGNT